MVINAKPSTSRLNSAFVRLKFPAAPSPMPIDRLTVNGCRVRLPVELIVPLAKVMVSAVIVISPEVELIVSATALVTIAALAPSMFKSIVPEPFAVIGPSRTRSPAARVMSTTALPPVVTMPDAPTVNVALSRTKIPPAGVVACKVPTLRSSAPLRADETDGPGRRQVEDPRRRYVDGRVGHALRGWPPS